MIQIDIRPKDPQIEKKLKENAKTIIQLIKCLLSAVLNIEKHQIDIAVFYHTQNSAAKENELKGEIDHLHTW